MSAVPSIKHYVFVAGALLALLLLTVGIAYANLGVFNTPVALLVSSVKALLILLYFMKIRRDGPLAMLFAAAGLFWLAILFVLSMEG